MPDPLELTDDDTAMLTEHAETVQTEAKRKFRLSDRLAGVQLATAKVVLFTDPVAAATYGESEAKVARLEALLATLEDEGQRAGVQETYEQTSTEADEARTAMLASALAVHLRAVPQVVVERAERHARKAYALNDGTVPQDRRDDFFRMQNDEVLGHTIVRVVDAEGNDYEVDRKTVAEELRTHLPVPQFQRLLAAFNQLVFNDALARQATADPGF